MTTRINTDQFLLNALFMRPSFLLSLLLMTSALFAQDGGTLRGKVLIEEHSGEGFDGPQGHDEPEYIGLPGAYVRWSHDVTSTTVTDGFGFFKIKKGECG